jgi:hypothetical protein
MDKQRGTRQELLKFDAIFSEDVYFIISRQITGVQIQSKEIDMNIDD